MPYSKISGMEPPSFKGFGGFFRVIQVPLHHRITSNKQLTNGNSILGDRLQSVGVGYHHICHRQRENALASHLCSFLFAIKSLPLVLEFTDQTWAIGFSQAKIGRASCRER